MKTNWKRILVWAVLFALIILSILQCNRQIRSNHEKQLVENLRIVTNQSVKTIETELYAQEARLQSMVAEAETTINRGASTDEIIRSLNSLNQLSGFKRVGYADKDGHAATTDGFHGELRDFSFFQKSVKGETVITGTIMDTMGTTEPINVLSAPVYLQNREICGIVYATYRNEAFQRLFDIDSFETAGSNCIVDEESKVISGTENLPFDSNKDTLFSFLESLGPDAADTMGEYYKRGERPDQLYFRVDGSGESDYYLYYQALDMGQVHNQWYVVTIVSAETLHKEVSKTMGAISAMLFEIIALVVISFILFAYDITSMDRKQRKELEKIAYTDPLTGGNNYAYFKEKVSKDDRIGYLVSMDIHSFKMINSVCGNEKGDEVICQIHQWICETVAPEDLVAHVNADRFVMFFPRLDKDVVIDKLTQINHKIIREMKHVDVPQLSAYYGITRLERGDSVEKAFSDANFARDSIHEKKDIFYSFFDRYATQHVLEEKKMEDSFDEAIAKHEFEVWYQPKISPDTQKIVGAEALVRWRRADGSLVSPNKFIPLFETNGMIRILDEYVFREVCKEQKELLDKGCSLFPISVNLSRASLYSMNLVERYKEITQQIGVVPEMVPIEITESATADDGPIQTLAEDFHKAGFPLHMDDFGTGYSSLSSLNSLHFDTLKLDKSLIDYIGNFGGDQLIKHTIALAKDLGMHVTAEGVEDEKQVAFLQQLKCDSIQGFYYSRPLSALEFEKRYAGVQN
ncbi:MAG: GGDEF domain-containing protein [Agathobacter sp.]|nr:GGDEF domain-containing protein [Agathobacter sp.]